MREVSKFDGVKTVAILVRIAQLVARPYKEERRVCWINAPADEITPNGTLVIEKIGRPAH